MTLGEFIMNAWDFFNLIIYWFSDESVHNGLVIILGIFSLALYTYIAIRSYNTTQLVKSLEIRFELRHNKMFDKVANIESNVLVLRRETKELSSPILQQIKSIKNQDDKSSHE